MVLTKMRNDFREEYIVAEEYCAYIGNDYGEGEDYSYYTESAYGYRYSPEAWKWNLYNENGELTPYRIIRGLRRSRRRANKCHLYAYQDDIIYRYMRKVLRAYGKGDKLVPERILLSNKKEKFGTDFFSDVLYNAKRNNRFYHGNRFHPIRGRKLLKKAMKKKFLYILDGDNYRLIENKLHEDSHKSLCQMITIYNDIITPPQSNAYEMKKRFGWKRFPPNWEYKHTAMNKIIEKQFIKEVYNA